MINFPESRKSSQYLPMDESFDLTPDPNFNSDEAIRVLEESFRSNGRRQKVSPEEAIIMVQKYFPWAHDDLIIEEWTEDFDETLSVIEGIGRRYLLTNFPDATPAEIKRALSTSIPADALEQIIRQRNTNL